MGKRPGPSITSGSELAEADTIAGPTSVRPENAYRVTPGTLLGEKFRVVRPLGRGGMGTVVEAFHLELQIPVAIKLLLPELMPYEEAAIRFQREARAAIKLESPHVAKVFDVDSLPSGEPYIVMELLKGQDLAERGREAIPLSVGEAVDYIVQASDAIAEAHTLGIVHRDLKPANLFVTRTKDGDPVVKVLDFGVSKVLSGSTGEVSLTQTTTILGSALYMSPEQMRSARDVDHRTDIYALGACLYELCARRPPYVANSFPELCALVYSGPPLSVTEWSPDVPDGLAKVIEKCLAHEPDGRYANVPEMVAALAPYAEEETRKKIAAILKRHAPQIEMPPVSRRRRSIDPALTGSATSKEGRSSRLAVALLFAIGILGLGAALRSRIPWLLQATGGAPGAPTATQTAPSPPRSAPPVTARTKVPAKPATTSTESGTATESATASASSDSETASPDASETASAEPAPTSAPPATASAQTTTISQTAPPVASSAAPSPAITAPPAATTSTAHSPHSTEARPGQPVVNPGLGEETCFAILPDGTKKIVPCN